MIRNVRCTHQSVGICWHMNACHVPRTHYNMCTSFNTGASTCGRNLIEASATIGDWAFLFAHSKYCVTIRVFATIGDLGYY